MADAAIRVERRGRVVRCTLDRPPLNLFEPGLIAALRSTFVELAGDATVGVVVLRGSGRAFTAGMNVNVLRDLGAGFELALACDRRVAARGAILGLPEGRVGVPSVIQAALLAPLIGPGRAAELLLTGATIGAEQALEWGLVNRVVEPSGLDAAVQELVDPIVASGPEAIRLQKQLIIRWRESTLTAAVRAGIPAFAAAYATGEPREGATAFLEKRAPRFEASR